MLYFLHSWTHSSLFLFLRGNTAAPRQRPADATCVTGGQAAVASRSCDLQTSASWKSDQDSVHFYCHPHPTEAIYQDLFLLYTTGWVWSKHQVSAFHWQQNDLHLCLSCPQLPPGCHVQIKPGTDLMLGHFALSAEEQVGWEGRGCHYFYHTVAVTSKQTFCRCAAQL